MTFDLTRAAAIDGWMDDPLELSYIAHAASRSYRIAEIGAWAGRSSVVLAQHTLGMVFSVDTWSASLTTRTEHNQQLFETWLANTAGLPVAPVPMESARAARMFVRAGLTFDFIFLDGDHTAPYLREDIRLWRPLLVPGGIFAGHDFDEPTWPEVAPVVREMVPGFRVVPGTRIWTTEAAS